MSFPKDFVWGAASASYQIEGAAQTDGKGLSVWDMMCRWPGKIANNENGNIACDHYYRYQEDVDLMAEIGLQAYRFSVSWPRVLPEGVGQINEVGLDFYDRLVDALLAKNIQPWLTLFHWDFPYALYLRGGWLNRDSADWFAEYTQVLVDRLSDRVQHWMTQNEPQGYLGIGHVVGRHAPGLQLNFADFLTAVHHSHLGHGKAVQVIRARAKASPQVGNATMGLIKMPRSTEPADVEMARQAMMTITEKNQWNLTWYTDPLFRGHYPEDGLSLFASDLPKILANDMATIHQPLDFYGFNAYSAEYVNSGEGGSIVDEMPYEGEAVTMMDWPVRPDCLYWGSRFSYERYQLPIVVAENGMANTDWVHLDGKVHDPQRIDYLARYLKAFGRACDDGVPIQGYFHWSATDNFEWAHGFKKRFGLIYVDFQNQKRILKDSAYWFRKVIASNGQLLEESE